MSNTMAAAHEPTMHYLDSILNEEEKRCDQYSHQWRNFTISRSGRFRSKNKKRDVVDGKLFDGTAQNDKISTQRNTASSMSKSSSSYSTSTTSSSGSASTAAGTTAVRSQRDKTESYKSFYETNL